MDNNLIVPGGAIVADNTLMKVQLSYNISKTCLLRNLPVASCQ